MLRTPSVCTFPCYSCCCWAFWYRISCIFYLFAQGCSQIVGWSVTCLTLVRRHVIGLMTEGQKLGKRYNWQEQTWSLSIRALDKYGRGQIWKSRVHSETNLGFLSLTVFGAFSSSSALRWNLEQASQLVSSQLANKNLFPLTTWLPKTVFIH